MARVSNRLGDSTKAGVSGVLFKEPHCSLKIDFSKLKSPRVSNRLGDSTEAGVCCVPFKEILLHCFLVFTKAVHLIYVVQRWFLATLVALLYTLP